MSRFSRTFAQLIRSGVPILEVLDIVGGSSGNHVIETSIKSVSEDVEKGDNLSVALSKKTIFPPMLLRMVSAGEATGKIDTMLEKMADFWDEEIEAMLDALTSLIEPMLDRLSWRDRGRNRHRDVPADFQTQRSSFAEQRRLRRSCSQKGRGGSRGPPLFLLLLRNAGLFARGDRSASSFFSFFPSNGRSIFRSRQPKPSHRKRSRVPLTSTAKSLGPVKKAFLALDQCKLFQTTGLPAEVWTSLAAGSAIRSARPIGVM